MSLKLDTVIAAIVIRARRQNKRALSTEEISKEIYICKYGLKIPIEEVVVRRIHSSGKYYSENIDISMSKFLQEGYCQLLPTATFLAYEFNDDGLNLLVKTIVESLVANSDATTLLLRKLKLDTGVLTACYILGNPPYPLSLKT